MKKIIVFALIMILAMSLVPSISAAEAVVYVKDGGTGNGASPTTPLGSLEAAFTKLGTAGGTIVLVGKCTLAANITFDGGKKIGFQSAPHTGLVTITSTYSGVDYAQTSGAQLYFAGAIHYRLNGPTTFKNLNFDFEGKNNIMAARFNPLTFDEGCVMLKNQYH